MRRHRRRRCSSCLRRRRISLSWRRRSSRSGCSFCRNHSSFRSRSTSGRQSTWRRRRTTSSSTTSTTRPSSTTSSINRRSRVRPPAHLKQAPPRACRDWVAQPRPRLRQPCRPTWRKGPRSSSRGNFRCRRAPRLILRSGPARRLPSRYPRTSPLKCFRKPTRFRFLA